eukprot:364844-Chlamydomonas_euryale.AAC.7
MISGEYFRQILSVLPRSHRAGTVADSLKRSDLCPIMKVFRLEQNMHVKRMASHDGACAAAYENGLDCRTLAMVAAMEAAMIQTGLERFQLPST